RPEKTYSFSFGAQPWSQVIDWLRDLTGLPIIGPHRPTGTLKLAPPMHLGPTNKYTVGEIIDILNDALLDQKLIILRREASIMIWPADEPLPLELVRHVSADDLSGLSSARPGTGSNLGGAPPAETGQRLA